MLTVTTTSTSDRLTSVSALKRDLGITGSSSDDDLDAFVLSASYAVINYVGYWPLRQRYTETVAGYGNLRLLLSATPIRVIGSMYVGTQLVDPNSYTIDKPDAGILHRNLGWPWTAGIETDLESHVVPGSETKHFTVDYEAGWILTTSTGIEQGNFLSSTGGRTLPYDFEQGVLAQAKSMYLGRRRDNTVQSKKVGQLSVTYRDSAEPLVKDAMGLLDRYRRIK